MPGKSVIMSRRREACKEAQGQKKRQKITYPQSLPHQHYSNSFVTPSTFLQCNGRVYLWKGDRVGEVTLEYLVSKTLVIF